MVLMYVSFSSSFIGSEYGKIYEVIFDGVRVIEWGEWICWKYENNNEV